MRDKKISIIIPVKENSKEIENCTKDLVRVKTENNLINFEIIYIDDFSTDNSWKKIIDLSKEYPDYVKGIRLGRNYGQQSVGYLGMKHASNSDYVITMDCDLEDDPNSIIALIDNLNEKKCDSILGTSSFSGPIFYRFFSKIYYYLMGTWSNVTSTDRHTNLRIYSKSCVNSLLKLNPSFFHLTHSLVHINAKIDYLSVNKIYKKRQSSYSITSKIKLAISTLFDLSSIVSSIFILLFSIAVLFIIFYYLYNIYIYLVFGSLSGFLSIITFLVLIIFMITINFFYLNNKLNNIIQFLYRGIDRKLFEDYFDIIEKIGFD